MRQALTLFWLKNCRVELQWRGTLDWWLRGSQTFKLQETKQLIKCANPLLYIHCCGILYALLLSSTAVCLYSVFVQWTLYHRAFLLWIFYRRPFFCGFRLSISLLSHHAVYTLPLWIQTQHLLAEPFGRLRIWAQHLLAESFGRCRFRLIISLLSHCVI